VVEICSAEARLGEQQVLAAKMNFENDPQLQKYYVVDLVGEGSFGKVRRPLCSARVTFVLRLVAAAAARAPVVALHRGDESHRDCRGPVAILWWRCRRFRIPKAEPARRSLVIASG